MKKLIIWSAFWMVSLLQTDVNANNKNVEELIKRANFQLVKLNENSFAVKFNKVEQKYIDMCEFDTLKFYFYSDSSYFVHNEESLQSKDYNIFRLTKESFKTGIYSDYYIVKFDNKDLFLENFVMFFDYKDYTEITAILPKIINRD